MAAKAPAKGEGSYPQRSVSEPDAGSRQKDQQKWRSIFGLFLRFPEAGAGLTAPT